MRDEIAPRSYKGHRFRPEITAYAVWLYYRFARSYCDVEDLRAKWGVVLRYETVRAWCREFGQMLPPPTATPVTSASPPGARSSACSRAACVARRRLKLTVPRYPLGAAVIDNTLAGVVQMS